MSLFRKLFNFNSKKNSDSETNEERGKFMPEIQLPVDEKFTINFKKNGGKFIYCDSLEEVLESFENILTENRWQGGQMYCIDNQLPRVFNGFDIEYTHQSPNAACFLTTCEALVADNGSILISSNQIKEKKLKELPDNFIVYATTSQLVENIGEGLRGIKNKNQDKIPSNITTIKHFEIKEEKDFMTYGSSSKNLYLLLLEDL